MKHLKFLTDEFGLVHEIEGTTAYIDSGRASCESTCGEAFLGYAHDMQIDSSKLAFPTCFACVEAKRAHQEAEVQRVARTSTGKRLPMGGVRGRRS